MKFKNSQGQPVTFSDINSLISEEHEYQVFVGSDSQIHKKKKCVVYATCIVLYKKGKGGQVIVSKESMPYASSLRERLTNEVWRSLTVAFELSKTLPSNVEIIIHVDSNKSLKHKSGKYTQDLVSLVTGQGYRVKIKPESWAAQCVADYFVKRK